MKERSNLEYRLSCDVIKIDLNETLCEIVNWIYIKTWKHQQMHNSTMHVFFLL